MKKYLPIIFLIVFLPWQVWGAGDGSVGDPYTTIGELNTAIDNVSLPATIYLLSKEASYTNSISLSRTAGSGTELVVSCSDGSVEDLGGCLLDADANFSGEYQTLKGFHFQSGNNMAEFTGSNNRLTDCLFEDIDVNDRGAISIGFNTANVQDNEIDHVTMKGTGTSWDGWMIRLTMRADDGMTGNSGTHIHHSVFKDHANAS
jgi:hypothetical protein